jgi:chromatin segregation and condensation protein Rec8/ScpA/Scc1 (kleisin family)
MNLLQLIIDGSDFQSVLREIIIEEGLDPWNIDITKLADSLLNYLKQLKEINFRVPARFILVSAILLRLKSESLIEEEMSEKELETIDIDGLEILESPINRIPKRNITFEELTQALEKVMGEKERKEQLRLNKEEKIEKLQRMMEIDIEDYVGKVFRELSKVNNTSFYKLTNTKNNLETARYFIAVLHLADQQKIFINQENLFEDFYISVK